MNPYESISDLYQIYPVGPIRRWVGHMMDIEVADLLERPKEVTLKSP